MHITLDREYYIEDIDPYNVVLRKTCMSFGSGANKYEKPKAIEKDIGYYRTPEQAMRGYFKRLEFEKTEDFNGNAEEFAKRIENIINNALSEIRRLNKW